MSQNLFFHHVLPSGLAIVTAAAAEPVSTAEAKLWARIEADFEADDDLLDGLVAAARAFAEAYQKRTLITTTYRLTLDQFPGGGVAWSPIGAALFLPLPKLQTVTWVKYTATDGVLTTLSSTRYVVDDVSQPARLSPVYSQPWPVVRPQAAAVQVQYVAGYAAAANVPESTKTAIKMLVAHWYRNREAVGTVGGPVELSVKALLDVDAVGGLY